MAFLGQPVSYLESQICELLAKYFKKKIWSMVLLSYVEMKSCISSNGNHTLDLCSHRNLQPWSKYSSSKLLDCCGMQDHRYDTLNYYYEEEEDLNPRRLVIKQNYRKLCEEMTLISRLARFWGRDLGTRYQKPLSGCLGGICRMKTP